MTQFFSDLIFNPYINCLGLGFLSFRNCEGKHPIFEGCFDYTFIDVVRKREATGETAVETFDPMEFFVFLFLTR